MRPSALSPLTIVDIDAHPPFSLITADHIGELNTESFFIRLNSAGIDAACGRLIPPPGFFEMQPPNEAITRLNRAAWDLAAVNSGYFPALWIHPGCPDASIAQLEKYGTSGVRLFEIDASQLTHPDLPGILARAQSLGMTLMMHGEKIAQADELAAQFPALNMLVGGLGSAGYMPAPTYELLMKHANISINLSGIYCSFNYVLHEWTERFGPDRLFFGTGYPFSNPAGKLAGVRWELRDQPDSVRSRIFNENALRLLGAEGRLG